MFIRSATVVLLNFLQVIYAAEPTITFDDAVTNEVFAAKTFAEIKQNEVLPLVFNLESGHLYHPVAILAAATLNRRMVPGTRFIQYVGIVLYFCPKEDSQDTCLASHTFQENDPLECAKEAIPMKKNEHPCGTKTKGTSFDVVYGICSATEYQNTEMEFYTVCYNRPKSYTMYTSHIILSPFLLSSYLLYREHNMKYPITVNDAYRPSLLDGIEDETISDLKSVVHPEKRAYKLQTLVPPADMAMALWKKTTYQNFNLSWQHEKLIPLWDEINERVRKYAVKLFRDQRQLKIRTGVFDINPNTQNDDQMNNTWVKIISFASPDKSGQIKAVAIMMNNFIGPVTTESDSLITFSNEIKEPVENMCKKDWCMKSLQDEFRNVGGRVSCCLVTQEILDLFEGVKGTSTESEKSLPILYIPGVNSEFLPPVNPSESLI